MPRIKYQTWGLRDTPGPEATAIIEQANTICRDYARQGYDLTLRQLYYQFVARTLIPNTMQSYKRLGGIINDARLCGLLDWHYIVDRTRNLYGTPHMDGVSDAITTAAYRFRLDSWTGQELRIEVFVEKEALADVVGRAAGAWDIDYFPCKGNVSQSEMWRAGRRHLGYIDGGQRVLVLYLGDHDPNGIDMTRDVESRLSTFIGHPGNRQLEVRRIALNMDQVEQYAPPPNPVKLTDSRSTGYIEQYGHECWELDALDPATLDALIQEHIAGEVDMDALQVRRDEEAADRERLAEIARRWDEVSAWLGDEGGAGGE